MDIPVSSDLTWRTLNCRNSSASRARGRDPVVLRLEAVLPMTTRLQNGVAGQQRVELAAAM